ncbi:MAG: lytic transglycosylase domain-containing protein [Acidobacteriota bacterium]|nr:lytic transglycosylase domain-containing protein [Acidobacteriota bacterium]
MNAFGIFLCALVAVLEPFSALAQEPTAAMGSWRAGFSEQLDQEIAKLDERSSTDQGTLLRVDRNTPGDPLKEDATFDRLAAGGAMRLPSMIDILLRQHGLSTRLAGIVKVESGFNPVALSPKGALGMWQLMPDTARRYGLAVNAHQDDRLDTLKSTAAAASYLRDLYRRFQNWPLVLAAYNAGEDRVQQAIDRVGTRDFWTLSRERALPEETRRYVPKVLSAAGSGFSDQSAGSNLSHPFFSAARMLTFDNNLDWKWDIVFATVSPESAAQTGRQRSFVTRAVR